MRLKTIYKMSTKPIRYTIQLDPNAGATQCINPKVTWDKPLCGDISCVSKDGLELTIEVPASCAGECFDVHIQCDTDDCVNCGEQVVTICPCQGNEDCGECKDCIGNQCVERCPGQKCADDICVDCVDNTDCTGGRECRGRKCECPDDKPYTNSKGECVPCANDGHCPPCFICDGANGCIPIDCGSGTCDPETGTCTGCVNSSDCPDNETCNGSGQCVCLPGLVRDPITGRCVPAPECTKDSDCGDCQQCNGNGKCGPVNCPDGTVCVGDACVPLCDCSAGPCNATQACVDYNGQLCICKTCEELPNGDCSPGCYRNPDTGNCEPSPCGDTNCVNGADCANGCGCDQDTNKCIPCNTKDCPGNCDTVTGCGCTGQGCADVTGGCDGGCVSSDDCGVGCTCDEAECTSCANYTCEECADRANCECVDGKCVGSPGGPGGCQDDLSLEKIDESCDLKATLLLTEGCACSKMSVTSEVIATSDLGTSFQASIKFAMRKGGSGSVGSAFQLPLVSDASNPNIADNEEATQAPVRVRVVVHYIQLDAQGRNIGRVAGSPTDYDASLAGVGEVTVTGVDILKPGTRISNNTLEVDFTRVEILVSGDLKFPNECIYDGPSTLAAGRVRTLSDVTSMLRGAASLSTDMTRDPILVWKKSENGTFGQSSIIRKNYIPLGAGGIAVDTLFGPDAIPNGKYPLTGAEGLLHPGSSYRVSTDCGCDRTADIADLRFCNPKELNFELDECNTKITLKAPFNPCDVNRDSDAIPSAKRTKWNLYLNGELKGVYRHDRNLGMVNVSGGSMFSTITHTASIRTIRFEQVGTQKCAMLYELEDLNVTLPESDIDCTVVGGSYDVRVNQRQGTRVIDSIEVESGSVTQTGSVYTIRLPKGEPTEVTYFFQDGCKISTTFEENCCNEMSVAIGVVDGTACTEQRVLEPTITGGVAPFTYAWTNPNGSTLTTERIGANSTLTDGLYNLLVRDSIGCEQRAREYRLTRSVPPKVTVYGAGTFCFGQTPQEVVIQVSSTSQNVEVDYILDGNKVTRVVPADGLISLGIPTGSQTLSLVSATVNGCVYPLNVNGDVVVLSEESLSLSTSAARVCRGSDVTIIVSGPANGVVTVQNAGTVTLDGDGEGTLTATNIQSATAFTITRVVSGNCDASLSSPSTTVEIENLTPISLISNECNASLDARILAFSAITQAFSQSGGVLNIQNNSVTVDPTIVTSVRVVRKGVSCDAELVVPVADCECSPLGVDVEVPGQACQGEIIDLTADVTGSNGALSYQWRVGSTVQTTASAQFQVSNTSYNVALTVTDVAGCVGTASVTIPAGANTLGVISTPPGFNNIVCENGSVLLTAMPGSATTKWYRDGILIATGNTYNVSGLAPGDEHTYSYTDVSGNGCDISSNDLLISSSALSIEIGPRTCDGNRVEVEFTINSSGEDMVVSMTSSASPTRAFFNTAGIADGTYTWLLPASAVGALTMYVTGSDSGCESSDTSLIPFCSGLIEDSGLESKTQTLEALFVNGDVYDLDFSAGSGGAPSRMIVKAGTTVLFDTGFVSKYSACYDAAQSRCGQASQHINIGDQFPNVNVSQSRNLSLNGGVGVANTLVSAYSNFKCTGTNDPISAQSYTFTGTITVPAGADGEAITVEIINNPCNTEGSYPWNYTIEKQ